MDNPHSHGQRLWSNIVSSSVSIAMVQLGLLLAQYFGKEVVQMFLPDSAVGRWLRVFDQCSRDRLDCKVYFTLHLDEVLMLVRIAGILIGCLMQFTTSGAVQVESNQCQQQQLYDTAHNVSVYGLRAAQSPQVCFCYHSFTFTIYVSNICLSVHFKISNAAIQITISLSPCNFTSNLIYNLPNRSNPQHRQHQQHHR